MWLREPIAATMDAISSWLYTLHTVLLKSQSQGLRCVSVRSFCYLSVPKNGAVTVMAYLHYFVFVPLGPKGNPRIILSMDSSSINGKARRAKRWSPSIDGAPAQSGVGA